MFNAYRGLTRYVSNPIIPLVGSTFYTSQLFDPSLIEDPLDSDYVLMYMSGMTSPVATGTISIGLWRAAKSDPYTWSLIGQVLTPTGGSGDFDESHVRLSTVLYRSSNSKVYLFYEGIKADGSTCSVGVATSVDGGRTFTRFGSNPILTPTGQGRNDGTYVSQFSVLADADNDLSAIYSYRNGGTIMPALRYASSTDWTTWTKSGSDVVSAPDGRYLEFHHYFKDPANGRYQIVGEWGSTITDYTIFSCHSASPSSGFTAPTTFFRKSGTVGTFDRYHVATPHVTNLFDDGLWHLIYQGAQDHDQPYGTNTWPLGIADYAAADVSNGLLTDLAAFWILGEASGSRADSVGSETLSDSSPNGVVSSVGHLGNLAADFVLANSTYVSRASDSVLQFGDRDFTIAGWFKAKAIGATMAIVSKDSSTSGKREVLLVLLTDGTLQFSVFKATDTEVTASWGSTLSAETWYFVAVWHDAGGNTAYISVNNGTPVSQAVGGSLQAASDAPFRLGSNAYSGSPMYLDGQIEFVGLWNALLSSDQRTALYNGGVGLPYEAFDVASAPDPDRAVPVSFLAARAAAVL